jgi:hypothetical protein
MSPKRTLSYKFDIIENSKDLDESNAEIVELPAYADAEINDAIQDVSFQHPTRCCWLVAAPTPS